MLRMTLERRNGHRVRMRLEGRMVGPWIDELSGVCDALRAAGERFDLEMSGVSFLSAEAVRFVRALNGEGVGVDGCSEFVREQLRGGVDDPAACV